MLTSIGTKGRVSYLTIFLGRYDIPRISIGIGTKGRKILLSI